MNSRNLPRFVTCMTLSIVFLAIPAFADPRPNVVVIMVDDLGYSDLGCYGGEIETPNLDGLASGGLRFSQFYNTAKCHSSRVSLLSGQYCIAAGDVSLSHAVTTAEVLGGGGYFTAMTGKWHLKQEPTDFGFDRYFGHLSGACNYFAGDDTFRFNGEEWRVPKDGFYTTAANVDFALRFLREARQASKPWYLYVAFNAPHAPLHALPEDYAKYRGRYDEGWDIVRDARIAKQKSLGLLPESMRPSPRPKHVPAWQDLQPWQQDYESDRMSTLAAMIDRVDQEVGRLLDDLRANDEIDNTLLLFVSDNGACPYDRKPALIDVEPTDAETFYGDSTGWSWARNSPFRYYKQNQFEGGISTPAIVHWPAGIKTDPGSIVDHPTHLIDVMPTIAEVTRCEIPEQWEGRDLRPVSGESFQPILDGETVHSRRPIHFLFSSDRALRDGDWKIVSFRGEQWELYNMAHDRTELHNLAQSNPRKLRQMVGNWTDMARDVLHAAPRVYAPVKPAELPHRHPEWTNFAARTPEEYTNRGRAKKNQAARVSSKKPIRARKNTKIQVVDRSLRLTFTGDDPGIAMDLRNRSLPPGPYELSFQLVGGCPGGGDVYFTTNPKVTLPKGEHVTFPVRADGTMQDVTIVLSTDRMIHQLRIDVCDNVGEAMITNLHLRKTDGEVLMVWPESK